MKKLVVGLSAEDSVVLIEGQLKYFKEKGFETYLLIPYSERVKQYCESEGCTHLRINIRRDISLFWDFVILLRIIYLFYCVKPDVINLGTPKVSLLGMIAGKILGIRKRIYTCRGLRFEYEKGLKRRILILMEKVTAHFSHTVICISPSLREKCIKNRLFSEKKSIVINKGSSNGINLKKFSPQNINSNDSNQVRRILSIEQKFVFGYVGRLTDGKGINELYLAFTDLSKQLKDIVLLLVGEFHQEQIANEAIINLIKSHNQIRFAGYQKNVPLYMSVIDVFIMPTWEEGFGNVMIQAAAMGIPVIGTNTVGAKDAINHQFNGLLVEKKSVIQLEETMLLLYEDKYLRDEFGENGLIWARNFDNILVWKGLEDLYNSAN